MKKRSLSLLLALIMVVAVISGCTTQQPTAKPTDPPTEATESTAAEATAEPTKSPAQLETETAAKLVCYVPGDLPGDLSIVLGEANKTFKEKINAELEIYAVPWGDFSTKYPLLIASGETVDMMYTADWSYYFESVDKDGFVALDDLLADYAPSVLAKYAPNFLESARVNGKLYMIPSLNQAFNSFGYIVRGDLMDKYGVTDIKNYKDFFAYLRAIKPEGMIPLDTMANDSLLVNFLEERRDRVPSKYLSGYLYQQPDGSVSYALDDPEFVEFLREARKAYEDGLWSKSVLSSQATGRDVFENGKTGAFLWNVYTFDSSRTKAIQNGYDWDVRFFEAGATLPNTLLPATANGYSVPISSKNAKRVLMLLNLLLEDQTLYTLMHDGIKGVHYDVNDKNEKVLPEGKTAADILYPQGYAFVWAIENVEHRDMFVNPLESQKLKDEIAENPTKGVMLATVKYGFYGDYNNFKTESAACTAAITKYFMPLLWGTLDVDAGIADCRAKLEAAGIETLRAEYEKQTKAFMQSKGLKTLFDD